MVTRAVEWFEGGLFGLVAIVLAQLVLWKNNGLATMCLKMNGKVSEPKKDRSLELVSVPHECRPGQRKVAVKVVDIFGNDTMTIAEVTV